MKLINSTLGDYEVEGIGYKVQGIRYKVQGAKYKVRC